MKYIKRSLLLFLIILISFSIFGSVVIHSTSNNNPGGSFGKTETAIVFFAKIPMNSIKVFNCYVLSVLESCEGLGGKEFEYIKHKNKKHKKVFYFFTFFYHPSKIFYKGGYGYFFL